MALLSTFEKIVEQLDLMNQQVKEKARETPEAKLLMTIPGIGPITSLFFLAEIDDPHRFRESRQVGAYIGMTPKQYQSGEVNRYGRISRCGSKELRRLLTEAGIVILTRTSSWSRLKSWGVRLASKKGTKKAALAVGRKLSVIMHRMLITDQPFARNANEEAQLKLA